MEKKGVGGCAVGVEVVAEAGGYFDGRRRDGCGKGGESAGGFGGGWGEVVSGKDGGLRTEFRKTVKIVADDDAGGEVRSQLYVAADVGYLDQPAFSNLLAAVEGVG